MYDEPLSMSTTALLLGASETDVVGTVMLSPTMMASRRTDHLVGDFSGQVGIASPSAISS